MTIEVNVHGSPTLAVFFNWSKRRDDLILEQQSEGTILDVDVYRE